MGTLYDFTNCSSTGRIGPSQTQINNTYSGTTLDGKVTEVGYGEQEWSIPETGIYKITAAGAAGANGNNGNPGAGAEIVSELSLDAGDTIRVIVGQKGNTDGESAGGGGGSFVYDTSATAEPLVAAGGGGGSGDEGQGTAGHGDGLDGQTGTSGTDTPDGSGSGGTGGDGGGSGGGAGAGAGWKSSGGGSSPDGGLVVKSDARGGATSTAGGFGGAGAAVAGADSEGGGGGGGYSGGGGSSGTNDTGGGGGGSYDQGTRISATAGANTGQGYVTFEYVQKPPNAPDRVRANVRSNDDIILRWRDRSSGSKQEDNFHVQVSRDGATYTNPTGGPTEPGQDVTSATYGPNSDYSYGSQIGIDSSFKFRIRAENGAGNSSWTESGVGYTDPIPPHNSHANRPDGDTVEIGWTAKSDVFQDAEVHYREDTGNGFGSWTPESTPSGLKIDTQHSRIAVPYQFNGSSYSSLTLMGNLKTTDADGIIVTHDYSEYYRVAVGNIASAGCLGVGFDTGSSHETVTGTTRVDDGNWHHWAITFDSGDVTIYLDGNVEATGTLSSTTFGSGVARTGFYGVNSEANGDDYYFTTSTQGLENAEMNDMRAFQGVATQTQVQSAMGGNSISVTSPLWKYTTDSITGTPTLTDQTGNGNDGECRGAVRWNFGNGNPTTLTASGVLKQDARYQFRIRNHGYECRTSDWVYPDYGNDGKVFFEDDFESIDLSGYAGETGQFGMGNSNPHSGVYAVARTSSDNSHGGIYYNSAQVSSGSALTSEVWFYHDGSGTERGGAYLCDTTGAGYVGYLDPGNALHIGKVSGPTAWGTSLNTVTDSNPASGFYRIQMKTDGAGNLTAELFDSAGTSVSSVTATDSTHSPTTVGVWSYDTNRDYDDLKAIDGTGTTVFQDSFENWDYVHSPSGYATVKSGSGVADLTMTGADSGTYYFETRGSDGDGLEVEYLEKDLGDLSGESNVIVKCAMAASSLDSGNENFGLTWYDGTAWQELRVFSHEYNRQGWVDVSALVPDTWLSTNNKLRVGDSTGSGLYGGDYAAFDRVVVSDILHEYTSPADPSGLSVDTSVEDEIYFSWTNNHTFSDKNLTYNTEGIGQDFEDGMGDFYNGFSRSTTQAYSGSYSLYSSGATGEFAKKDITVPSGSLVVNSMMYITGSPTTAYHHFCTFYGGTDWAGPHVAIRTDGNVHHHDGSWNDSGYTFPVGKWVSIKCIIDIDTQSFSLYIDGNQVIGGADFIPRNSFNAGDARRFRLSGQADTDVYYDDIRLDSQYSSPGTGATSEGEIGLPDGVTYTPGIVTGVVQERYGAVDGTLFSTHLESTGTTIFPGPTGLSLDSINEYSYDLSWTPNADNGTHEIHVSTDGGTTWTTDTSGLSNSTSSGTTGTYSTDTKHHLKVIAKTPYVSKETSVIVESLAGNTIRRVNGALKTNAKGEVMTEW